MSTCYLPDYFLRFQTYKTNKIWVFLSRCFECHVLTSIINLLFQIKLIFLKENVNLILRFFFWYWNIINPCSWNYSSKGLLYILLIVTLEKLSCGLLRQAFGSVNKNGLIRSSFHGRKLKIYKFLHTVLWYVFLIIVVKMLVFRLYHPAQEWFRVDSEETRQGLQALLT